MIISRTPFRVSFFGGGTDYPAWFREHGGAVLATTINKYCYISARYLPPFFEHASRIVWSQIELVRDRAEIQHPVVREALAFLGITQGVELHHQGDLPARTGLGSSSAFTVGVLNALYGLRGMMAGKEQLAREAIAVEQERLKEHVGCQDQIVTAYGGLNRVDFWGESSFRVSPIMITWERVNALQSHLMLLFTGLSRTASEIAAEQVTAIPTKVRELRVIHQMVDEAIAILRDGRDLADFGRLLDESWQLKRSLTDRVSTAAIDDIYATARRAGCLGGKLIGAGGGGFMLLFAPPDVQPRIRQALGGLLHVPFRLESLGSHIVFYERQDTAAFEAAR
jgi:D-glycero-alpha-D-manno-heptose-7-phosphate kinase